MLQIDYPHKLKKRTEGYETLNIIKKMSKVLSHEESEAIFKKLRSNPANKVGTCAVLFANVLGVF